MALPSSSLVTFLGVAHAPSTRAPIDVFRTMDSADVVQGFGRYGLSSRSSCSHSHSLAHAFPARAFDSRTTRFVPARVDRPTAASARYRFQFYIIRRGPLWPSNSWAASSTTRRAFFLLNSRRGLASCSLMNFKTTSVPEGSTPSTSCRSPRTNPILGIEEDAILDPYFAAGLIQHSNLYVFEPTGGHPQNFWRRSNHHEV